MSCKFYLEKKKRHCRFQPKPGSNYCVEHACVLGVSDGKKRIPCPLDPSHNCFEDNLEKHLKKCNVTKIRKATEKHEFFVRGINLGQAESRNDLNVSLSELSSNELASMIDRVKQLYKDYVEIPEVCVLEHPSVKVEVSTTVNVISNGSEDNSQLGSDLTNNRALRKELLQQASLIGQLETKQLLLGTSWFVELGAGKGKLSHWVKKAFENNGSDSGSQMKDAAFLLVDRSSVRYKMDCFHKEDSGGSHFKRIKVDIADLCLGKVSDIKDTDSIVVIGKHLCGGATDLGIRCAVDSLTMRTQNSPNKQESNSQNSTSATVSRIGNSETCESQANVNDFQEPPSKTQKLENIHQTTELSQRLPKGIMIALCCHHRCTWSTYVGQEFMQQCNVTPSEFNLLTRLSSWATCAQGKAQRLETKSSTSTHTEPSTQNIERSDSEKLNSATDQQTKDTQEVQDEHLAADMISSHLSSGLKKSLSISKREEIGRMCKRIIDTGRLHYLRSKGMDCSLREYVSQDVTPENVVLLAYRS